VLEDFDRFVGIVGGFDFIARRPEIVARYRMRNSSSTIKITMGWSALSRLSSVPTYVPNKR
jgi:hypothetical protein